MQTGGVSSRLVTRDAGRDQIVVDHLSLVRTIALKIRARLPAHVELDDLVQAGALGLLDAANKYETKKGVAFFRYAQHRIKGAILDSLRQFDWAPRVLRCRQKQVEAATRELAAELKRAPSESEVAERLGVSPHRWRQIVRDLAGAGLLSSNGESRKLEASDPATLPANENTRPDSLYAQAELRELLTGVLQTLPNRYRRVVVLYYASELSMQQIADMLGVNESRVSQIHKRAAQRMAEALRSTGIRSTDMAV